MRFLRMLSNSAIAGTLCAGYLTVLVLHLNPSFPLAIDAVVPLALVMALAYGVHVGATFYLLLVARQLLASEVLSPGWLSVRVLSWLCVMAAGAGAALMWLNLRAYAPMLDEQTSMRMAAGAVALTASAVVFLLLALAHIGRRGGRVSAALLVATMIVSVAAPVATRGPASSRERPDRPAIPALPLDAAPNDGRVIVLAFDGATLDVISPAVAEGRLPGFGRIFDGGAVLHLATVRPTQAEPAWSAAMTGKRPAVNGVRAAALYRVQPGGPALEMLPDYCFAQALVRFGLLRDEPHTARSLAAQPLWSILGDSGLPSAVVGFPLTHPAPAINGIVVSDEFHRLDDIARALDAGAAVSPRSWLEQMRAAIARPVPAFAETMLAAIGESPPGADARSDPSPISGDRIHLQLFTALARDASLRFLAVRFPGLDAVGHYYLRFAEPSAFGDVSDEERRRYGRVLDDYYRFADAVVGAALDSLDAGDLLLVVSPFGMQPLTPGKRLLERLVGNPGISGTHERGPDGFLLAYGSAVQPGRPVRAALADLAPTVLYYLGLPVARDMDGAARTDLFRPSFTASRPVAFIPTYGR